MKRIKIEIVDEQAFHALHGKKKVNDCPLCRIADYDQETPMAPVKATRLSHLHTAATNRAQKGFPPPTKGLINGIRPPTKTMKPKTLRLPPLNAGLHPELAAQRCWLQQTILEREYDDVVLPSITNTSRVWPTASNKIRQGIAGSTQKRSSQGAFFLPPISQRNGVLRANTCDEVSGIGDPPSTSSSHSNATVRRGLESITLALKDARTPDEARRLLSGRLPHLMKAAAASVRSRRASEAIAACRAARAIFSIVEDCTKRPMFDHLVTSLLLRTADINKKLKAQTLRALSAMAENLPNYNVVRILVEICGGQVKGHLRAAAAYTLHIMTETTAPFYIMDDKQVRDLLCPFLASLLEDGNSEARNYARMTFTSLMRYDRAYYLFQRSVSAHQLQRLKKSIDRLLNQ